MAIVRIMNMLLKDKNIGKNIVPIVPDESRTFGMEGMFRSVGIWNQEGQNYVPEDHDQLMFYKESKTGQVLQEGINEAGAMSDWIAAATSYSVHNVQTIPFYICYSMFGLQRTLDLCWAAGDQRARGFLIGGTAGRTTLNGEGLQHEDGHSLILANLIPNCISYDPTFQYEVAVDRPGRHAPHVPGAGRRLLLPDGDERELRAPGNAGRRRGRHHQGHVRVQEGWRRQGAARATARFRHHLPRSDRRRRPAEERLGRRGRSLGLPELQRTGPQRPGRTAALEPAAPARGAAGCRMSSRSWPMPRGRSSPPPTTSGCSPSRSAPSSGRRTSRWAPTASAAPTPARNCATFSRSTATGSRWLPSRRWPTPARSPARRSPPPWSSTTLTRTSRTRCRFKGRDDMSQIIEVKVPDIGDFSDVPVIDLFVKVGDSIKVDDAIATLESDKATMDVPSTVDGVVKEVLVQLGSKVSEGSC
jgi:biotin carboxyl carrier protein